MNRMIKAGGERRPCYHRRLMMVVIAAAAAAAVVVWAKMSALEPISVANFWAKASKEMKDPLLFENRQKRQVQNGYI